MEKDQQTTNLGDAQLIADALREVGMGSQDGRPMRVPDPLMAMLQAAVVIERRLREREQELWDIAQLRKLDKVERKLSQHDGCETVHVRCAAEHLVAALEAIEMSIFYPGSGRKYDPKIANEVLSVLEECCVLRFAKYDY